MGLDMYAFVTDEKPTKEVDFPEPEKIEQLHYWRKHPDLHGWMEQLYATKGGSNPDFDLDPLMLTSHDLDQLEAAIREKNLPETSGLFFGESDGSEIDDDLEFVGKARAAIGQGRTVFYLAWW